MTRFQENTLNEIRLFGPLTMAATKKSDMTKLNEMVRAGLLVKERLVNGFVRYSEPS